MKKFKALFDIIFVLSLVYFSENIFANTYYHAIFDRSSYHYHHVFAIKLALFIATFLQIFLTAYAISALKKDFDLLLNKKEKASHISNFASILNKEVV